MQEVLVFGTKHCPRCNITKKLLEAKGIAYNFIDVDEAQNTAAFDVAIEKVQPSKTLPILKIGEEYVSVANPAVVLSSIGEAKCSSCQL